MASPNRVYAISKRLFLGSDRLLGVIIKLKSLLMVLDVNSQSIKRGRGLECTKGLLIRAHELQPRNTKTYHNLRVKDQINRKMLRKTKILTP